jgi:hypothetical protein
MLSMRGGKEYSTVYTLTHARESRIQRSNVVEIKETRYTVPARRAADRAAKSRKAAINALSTSARRGCSGGWCPYCESNRTHAGMVAVAASFEALRDSFADVPALTHSFAPLSSAVVVGTGNVTPDGLLMVGENLTTVATVAHYVDGDDPVVSCYGVFDWDDGHADHVLFAR